MSDVDVALILSGQSIVFDLVSVNVDAVDLKSKYEILEPRNDLGARFTTVI